MNNIEDNDNCNWCKGEQENATSYDGICADCFIILIEENWAEQLKEKE